MNEKIYLSAEEYQLNSFKLANKILNSRWNPDEMIALWRGGAPVGVIVHEFLYWGIHLTGATTICSMCGNE